MNDDDLTTNSSEGYNLQIKECKPLEGDPLPHEGGKPCGSQAEGQGNCHHL